MPPRPAFGRCAAQPMPSRAGNVERPALPSENAPAQRWRAEALVIVLVALAIGWFYAWSARPEDAPWHFGQRQTDYYNLLVDGMLKGHLSLDVDVPPALLAVKDPYDPAQRPPGIALHDTSLYQGKYYLYFGVAPVVTLLLPFRLFTHTALPLPAAIVVFAYAGFLLTGMTWVLVRRRYFPAASRWLSTLVLVALGTASMVPVLVRRANVWELPLSGAYFFSSAAILCLYQALHARRKGAGWFAGASLALGLAVASRPTYLFGAGLILVPILWNAWRFWPRRRVRAGAVAPSGVSKPSAVFDRSGLFRLALAGLIPLVAVGIAMAAYNYARFGNPLEFGVSYQLSGIYESKARHFSLSYLPYNLRLYALAPFNWSIYFPYIHAAKLPARPVGHYGVEEVCGILPHVLIVWFALLAPLAAGRRPAEERGRLLTWLTAIAVTGIGTLATLGFFYAVVGRYECDFMPEFVLLAGVGVLAVERWLQQKAARGLPFIRIALGAVAVASAGFAVLFSLILYGNFQRSNPRAYTLLAHLGDYPAYWLERATPPRCGAVEMNILFPVTPATGRESLLSTGWYGRADHVFVEYGAGERVRLGFDHDAGGQFFSPWVTLARDRPHRLRIELGALYPPEEDPTYHGWSEAAVFRITRRVHIELDGTVMIDRYARFESPSPRRVFIGINEDASGGGTPRFSGKILAMSRDADFAHAHSAATAPAELDAVTGPTQFDRVTMKIRLASPRPIGAREPLVVTGVTGGADFLYIEYLDQRHVRFGLEHWGKAGIFSPVIDWPGAAERALDVALGSFPTASSAGRASHGRVTIRIDGALVWTSPARFYLADSSDVFVARNPVGGTACMPSFSGTISEAKRIGGE